MSKLQGKLRGIFEILSKTGVVVSNIFYVYPELWGRWTHFDDHIFGDGWFNHQLENVAPVLCCFFTEAATKTTKFHHFGVQHPSTISPLGFQNWDWTGEDFGDPMGFGWKICGGVWRFKNGAIFPCHVIFGVSLTILCSSICRKEVGSLLCADRWYLFVDSMHCWVLRHKYNKYIQFGSLAVPLEWFLNIRNYMCVCSCIYQCLLRQIFHARTYQGKYNLSCIYDVYILQICYVCIYIYYIDTIFIYIYTYTYMGVVLKVLDLSVVFDDLWYAKMTFGES